MSLYEIELLLNVRIFCANILTIIFINRLKLKSSHKPPKCNVLKENSIYNPQNDIWLHILWFLKAIKLEYMFGTDNHNLPQNMQ